MTIPLARRARYVPTPFFLTIPLLSAALACGHTEPLQEPSVSRDSAGVVIVENPMGAGTLSWEVDREPQLTIGSISGDPDQELDQVTGAVRLAGDRIVVANGGRMELLFYDRNGVLLRRVGGRGSGPGEFQSLEWVARVGPDSVLALDVRGQRISYFDGSGNFVRSVRLEPNARLSFPRPVGFFADGSILGEKGPFVLGGDPPAGRVLRDPQPLFHISSDGRTVTELGSFPGSEQVIVPAGPRGGLERRSRPFGRETVSAAAGDRFYVADNEKYEIRVFSMTGRLIRIIRKETMPVPLEASRVQAYEDSVIATTEERARPQMRTVFATMPPPPPTYPAFAPAIRVDADLNLWVKESEQPGEVRCSWSVFSSSGEFLGLVEMPPAIEVLEIGSDYVLGLHRDEFDIEYVQFFRLQRGVDAWR